MTGPPLHKLCGMDTPPKLARVNGALEASQEDWDALVLGAMSWMRAGQPDPEWWDAQRPIERLALAEAGDQVWADRCAGIGMAAQGPQGAAAVFSRKDGGKAALQLNLQAMAARLAEQTRGQRTGAP